MPISFVILAAGMGSRFKGGEKQTASVGPNGEMILEYSIYDAIEAGFSEVVFVIRRDMEESFREKIGFKIEEKIPVRYVFQELDDIPCEISLERKKPWGTGQAIYALRNTISNPFCVIHADDYYGKDAFIKMASFLKNECDDNHYAMLGYPLGQTLSKKGSVNRGICEVENSNLKKIVEVLGIEWNDTLTNKNDIDLSLNDICSMGCFGFSPSIFQHLEEKFITFLKSGITASDEFFLPTVVCELLSEGTFVKVIETNSTWIGITYQEDLIDAREKFLAFHQKKIYPQILENKKNRCN